MELEPNDTLHYDVKWYLRNIPDHIVLSVGSAELVDATRYITGSDVQVAPLELETPSLTEIIAYPNPAASDVYFIVPESGTYNLRICNLTGLQVLSKSITAMETVDVSALKAGIYLYSVSDNGSIATGKLVIE